ncbi:MAG: hypothetical protein JZD41_01360, partial [Thermoproteus sp.]|nr:hypothetical protein [Thermoproteus sp.]
IEVRRRGRQGPVPLGPMPYESALEAAVPLMKARARRKSPEDALRPNCPKASSGDKRFKRGNPFAQMRLLTDLLTLSAVLRSVAVDLYRLGQDIRLMYSGPFAGLGEVDLPGQGEIAGSSIMPGKTNPVTVEAAMLAAAQVAGLDHANQMASMYGEFELAMGIPLVGYNVVEQMKLLSEALRKMSTVVGDIRPNAERMRRQAESSPAIAAVLAARLGYDAAAKIAREIAAGVPAADALRRLGYEVDLEELAGLRRRANR